MSYPYLYFEKKGPDPGHLHPDPRPGLITPCFNFVTYKYDIYTSEVMISLQCMALRSVLRKDNIVTSLNIRGRYHNRFHLTRGNSDEVNIFM